MADVYVKGMREIGARLKLLPLTVKDKIATDAIAQGTKLLRDSAKAEAPEVSGLLKAGIRYARRRKNIPHDKVIYVVYVRSVRPSSGKRARGRRAKPGAVSKPKPKTPFYWYFVEFGTSRMAANPFMERAFGKSAMAALEKGRNVSRTKATKALRKQALG